MRFTFITGTPINVRLGSGTFVGISVLRQALEDLGHAVELVTPPPASDGIGLTAQRLAFNLLLAARFRSTGGLTVGFDLDGFLLPAGRTGAYLASIKGVLADELTFEQGTVRRLLALQAWCEKQNVRRSPLVVTTSRYAADRLAYHYGLRPERLRLVPELIDLNGWRASLDAAPGESTTNPVILSVAHMYPRKSLDVLLRAVALLPARWAEAGLNLVGIGPEQDALRRLAGQLGLNERVRFLGHIPRAQLAAEYRHCTLFCLPSRQEGFGIVLLEAMAAGRAVVACQAAAVPEVVPNGEAGVLVEPGDPRALAVALTTLLDDPTRRDQLGQQGREHVRRYDAPVVARAFLQVAEEALALARG